jgi:DNA repair exonuclease SbcCD ATPase subunit
MDGNDLGTKGDVALESIFESAGATVVGGGSEISQRIAAILDTAEEEAEKIRAAARAEAAATIRAAHASAADRIDELTREPERIKDESERTARELIRSAEAQAAKQVADAERQAAETIHQSEQQAEARRREADRMIAELEAAMDKRQRELRDEIRALAQLREHASGSVHEVVQTLQSVASDIDRKLVAIPDSTDQEPLPENGRGAFKLLSRRSNDE